MLCLSVREETLFLVCLGNKTAKKKRLMLIISCATHIEKCFLLTFFVIECKQYLSMRKASLVAMWMRTSQTGRLVLNFVRSFLLTRPLLIL